MSHLAPGCMGYYFKDAISNASTECLHDDLLGLVGRGLRLRRVLSFASHGIHDRSGDNSLF